MDELSRARVAPWAARGAMFSQPGLARPASVSPAGAQNDGQTILKVVREERHQGPDLLIYEPPYGIEP